MLTKGEEITLTIEDLGDKGEGIGRYEGMAVFAQDALPSEIVKLKIIKVKKSYAIGKVVERIEESPDRIVPPCPYVGRCGGCQIQELDYAAQLVHKERLVTETLARIGRITPEHTLPIAGMTDPWRYRNKGQYPIAMVEGKPVIGFYRQRSHDVVRVADCLLQSEGHAPILKAVEGWILKHNIAVYDEKKRKGLLRHLVIRNNDRGDLMVILVSNGSLASVEPLVAILIQLGVGSLYLNLNRERGNRIFGNESKLIYGEPVLRDHIGELFFELGPTSFFQVNPRQTVTLYEQALAFAGLTGEEMVFDLYAGIGTISMFLAKKAKRVVTVELHEGACEDAKKNAERNGLDNVEVHQGRAEEVIPELYAKGYRADVVVVDPPRKGCDPVLLDTIVKMQPERIVYVSCKPSTLARDLEILEEQGYRTKRVRAVDMFPHTTHVESVVELCKEG